MGGVDERLHRARAGCGGWSGAADVRIERKPPGQPSRGVRRDPRDLARLRARLSRPIIAPYGPADAAPAPAIVAIDVVLLFAAWYAAFFFRFDTHLARTGRTPRRRRVALRRGAGASVLIVCASTRGGGSYTSLARRAVARPGRCSWPGSPRTRSCGCCRRSTAAATTRCRAAWSCSTWSGRAAAGRRPGAWRAHRVRAARAGRSSAGSEVLVVGAGNAGELIVREMRQAAAPATPPIGLLDDDPRKQGMRLARREGARHDRPTSTAILRDTRPDEVVIAMPSAPAHGAQPRGRRLPARTACRCARCRARTSCSAPTRLRRRGCARCSVEDLLGREPVALDLDEIGALRDRPRRAGHRRRRLDRLRARAARSRRLGRRRLVLVDHAETQPLQRSSASCRPRRRPASVAGASPTSATPQRDARASSSDHRPEVVFHAAAHKHVPMMEQNPGEAVRNNVLGTRDARRASRATHGVERFVLISTDKAVNPQTVMGATKRSPSWSSRRSRRQHPARASSPCASATCSARAAAWSRSSASRSRRAARSRSPTREMTRYFMTIPEAASWCCRPAASGEGGEIFVLDMGEPVKIVDLARDLIRLSGTSPTSTSAIEFIGIRPGEKLYEELFGGDEGVEPTRAREAAVARVAAPIDAQWLSPSALARARGRVLARRRRRAGGRRARDGAPPGAGDAGAATARRSSGRWTRASSRRSSPSSSRGVVLAGRRASSASRSPRSRSPCARSRSASARRCSTAPAARSQPTEAGRAGATARPAHPRLRSRSSPGAARRGRTTSPASSSLGASAGPGSALLPAAPRRLPRGAPRRDGGAARRRHRDVIDRVLDGRSSSASSAPSGRTARCCSSRSCATRSCCCVPAGHAVRRPRRSRSTSCARRRCVVQQEGSGVRAVIERELRRVGVRPRDLNIVAELGPAGVDQGAPSRPASASAS